MDQEQTATTATTATTADDLSIRPIAHRKLAPKTGIQKDHAQDSSMVPPMICNCSDHAFKPPYC